METIKHAPDVYKLYDYLQQNHLGEKNMISRDYLQTQLARDGIMIIKGRELRKTIQTINGSNQLEKIISTSGGIYMCRTEDECQRAIHTTFAAAISLMKKAQSMNKKMNLNGQYKFKFGEYYKEFIKTFEEE